MTEPDKRRKAATINYKDMNKHGFNKLDSAADRPRSATDGYNEVNPEGR